MEGQPDGQEAPVGQWEIHLPVVYRYMDKTYVDKFFEDGSLRLSSFVALSAHNDAERNDNGEGWGLLVNVDKTGEGQTVFAKIGIGVGSYVLCTSTIYGKSIMDAFACNSGFKIVNTTLFGVAVGSVLNNCFSGIEGACVYTDQKYITKSAGRFDIESMKLQDGSIDMDKFASTIFGMAGNDLLFLKLMKYQHQSEYRFLWKVAGETQDFIDIKCPEARKFCVRLEDS